MTGLARNGNDGRDRRLAPKGGIEEEALIDISERVMERKRTTLRWKKHCERISLKGASFGEIEINNR